MAITDKDVLAALSELVDPVTSRNYVEAKCVKNVKIEGDPLSIDLLDFARLASPAGRGLLPRGRFALDGGWADKVPAAPARLLGAECVVAVDVSDELADTSDLLAGRRTSPRSRRRGCHCPRSIAGGSGWAPRTGWKGCSCA